MSEKNMHIYKKLHWLSLLIGALAILLPLVFWNSIPDRIPMHYNAAGVVDNWSDKSSLILLFFVIAMMMGMMSIVVYFVKSNLNSSYTAKYQKTEMVVVYQMLIIMNLIIQIMFAYIMFCCTACRPLGGWFLPVFVIGVSLPIAYMIYKCQKIGGTSNAQKAMYKEREKTEEGKVYRSKVDWWLGLLLLGSEALVIWPALSPILKKGEIDWFMMLLAVGTTVIIVPLFFIRYEMYSEHMLISMSIYGKERISYKNIVHVKKTMNPLSSAALSLKRIQIDYVEGGNHRMILISPKKRDAFIEELKELTGKADLDSK